MVDSKGRNGGSAAARVVKISEDTSCLSDDPKRKGGLSGSAVAGVVVGVLVLLSAIGLVGFFYWRRRRAKQNVHWNEKRNIRGVVDLGEGEEAAPTGFLPSEQGMYTATPFILPPNHLASTTGHDEDHSRASFSSSPNGDYGSSVLPHSPTSISHGYPVTTGTGRTSSAANTNGNGNGTSKSGRRVSSTSRASRLIVHSDITEVDGGEEGEEEVVELPPVYEADRRPIRSMPLHPSAPTRSPYLAAYEPTTTTTPSRGDT